VRRGISLLEVVVVLAITVTALLTALPILVSLLREQKGLTAEILRGDTLPLLHGRLDNDLANSRSLDIAWDQENKTTSLVLAPRDETAYTLLWTFSGTSLERKEVPPDGSKGPPPHTWTVAGALVLLPQELVGGRLGLLWQPATGGGPTEVLVLEGPRADEVTE
jgi:hypothetical protein